MTATSALARPLMAGMFIYGGLDAVRNPKNKVLPAETVAPKIARQLGLPEDTELLVRVNGGAQVAAGLMLATGRFPRVASAVLAATVPPTTLAGHRFWEEEDPTKRRTQTVQFLKNAAMFGGLLLSATDAGGRPSVTWRAKRQLRRAAKRTGRAAAAAASGAAVASETAQAVAKLSKSVANAGAGMAASAAAPAAHLTRAAAGAVPDLARAAGSTVSHLGGTARRTSRGVRRQRRHPRRTARGVLRRAGR